MNIEETKQAIIVMQAYVDGKDIQCKLKTSTKWDDIVEYSVSSWNWKKYDYRIKPQESNLVTAQNDHIQFLYTELDRQKLIIEEQAKRLEELDVPCQINK